MAFLDAPIHIEREDADLYVEQVGPQEAQSIYFLHGGPGYSSFSFRDLIGEELESWRLLYADQRGSGRSYAHAPFSLDDLAGDVEAVLASLQVPRATLLAHGFGALVAVRAALLHPERVERLLFVNPWFSMPLLARRLLQEARIVAGQEGGAEDELTDADPEELVNQAFATAPAKVLFDRLQFPTPSSRLRLEHSDATALFGPEELAMPDDPWGLDVLEDLPALEVPVVLMASNADGSSYPEQAEAGLLRMEHALFSLLPGGHYPWIDAPDDFLAVLAQALGDAASQ